MLTQSFARKIFGNTKQLLGKQVRINEQMNYTVTGIMKDLPPNTHLQKCDAMLNFTALEDIWGARRLMTNKGNCSFGLYFLAKENADLPSKSSAVLNMFKDDFWLYKRNYAKELNFEPIVESYFSSSGGPAINQNNKTFVLILSFIALLILILAVINYINLTIALSGLRGVETATKKILGRSRKRLIFQFIKESVIICFISMILAICLSLIAEPLFNSLIDTQLNIHEKLSFQFIIIAIFVCITIGTFSGTIPALLITRLNPVEVIKGASRRKTKGTYGNMLISFQYIIAIVLLITAFLISKQTRFLRNYDMGFSKDNIMWIRNAIPPEQKNSFRDELLRIPGVQSVTYTQGSPIDGGNNDSFNYNGKPLSFQVFMVDTGFFSMFNIECQNTGVAYSDNIIWLNETAVNVLDLKPLPQKFTLYGRTSPIYGIVNDFHFENLHQRIGPIRIGLMHPESYPWTVFVKTKSNDLFSTVNKIKQTYADFTNDLPIEYGFVNETIDQWYDNEEKAAKIISYFTILATILSAMGIFAMATYYIQQKIKEIGIRKVNGAKIVEVISMLNKNFLVWVAIAFVTAMPISYILMQKWLENFACRTEFNWWIFVLAGILTLGIALLTVSFQSWRAASRNPVEALRYE